MGDQGTPSSRKKLFRFPPVLTHPAGPRFDLFFLSGFADQKEIYQFLSPFSLFQPGFMTRP